MNNLLKIFLIFNLFSATTSAVNNYSQPLPETEWKMGQNVSGEIEGGRRKLYFPYLRGGMKVTGFTLVSGEECQRDCTLSFPVKNAGGRLGFLTSYSCSNNEYFVGNNEVGLILPPHKFDPSNGLDYTFVLVYDDYWSDDISRKIAYTECVQSGRGIVDIDELIPTFPVPNQPPLNSTVCAYGGESGLACGDIVESGVTIIVQTLGSCDAETAQFFNVTKVRMNKNYLPGDLGAPVYIPVQVPNSTQYIASPVGQVVENVAGPAEENVWYYTPLDRILADSGLKIVELNTTGLSNISASDDLAMKPNNSEIAIINDQPKQPQQPQQPLLMITRGGMPVIVSTDDEHFVVENANECTLGFAIKKPRGASRFDHGFLTLGSCLQGIFTGTHGGIFMPRLTQTGEIEEINVGTASDLWYDLDIGLNYAIVRILPNNDENIFWEDRWSTILLTPGAGAGRVVDPVTPLVGTRICSEGGYSGHICGEITSLSARLTVVNPWKWQRVIREIIATYLDVSVFDEFQGLIKVRLDTRPRALSNGLESDAGSPVYFPINGVTGIDTVLQVGILLKLTQENELDGDRCVPRYYMYCVSISRIFELNRFIELIKTPA